MTGGQEETSNNESEAPSVTLDTVKEEVAKAIEAALPPYLETVENTLKELIHQEFARLKSDEADRGKKRTTYKEFVACHPKGFKGEVDPILSQRWISEIESTFEISRCEPEDRVLFAGNQLTERAKDWFETLK